MGVVDVLNRARRDYERGDWRAALEMWSGVAPDEMHVDDLHAAAQAAYLLGHRDTALVFYQRAFQAQDAAGDTAAAVRSAFHLAMTFSIGGEHAQAAGWTSRADRLLDELGEGSVEEGYVAFLHMYRHLQLADWAAASTCAALATAAGLRGRDPDLLALGRCSQGRLDIYSGNVAEGLALLDEAMAAVAGGEVTSLIAGNVYCTAIEGCQEIGEFNRVSEWTAALQRWCEAQPGLVAFTGQCAVHRGQVMRLRGAWTEALEEYGLAIARYRQAESLAAVGLAECELGDVLRLRGDYDAAEAAYQRSSEQGHDPQPGLALLWLARGSDRAAVAAVRRQLSEVAGPVHRCRLLPAAIDVLLAVGALEEARAVLAELDEHAGRIGSTSLLAAAGFAAAAVEVAAGDAAGALPYLRKARQLWARVGSPYEGARVRLLAGCALSVLDDVASARGELEAARESFRGLGAAPAVAEVDRLLHPGSRPRGLTEREVEVLRLVAAGRSNTQIATELVLSDKTVARHLSNIFGKLEVASRTAAAAYAFEHDLV